MTPVQLALRLWLPARSGIDANCRGRPWYFAVSPSGRSNIGLLNKIRAYALQDQGYDTVEANHQLGFAADERDFTLCADMFKLLGVNEVRLLTNNPKKVEILTEAGINIVERVPLIVGRNPNNEHYLDTKAEKMGHLLNK